MRNAVGGLSSLPHARDGQLQPHESPSGEFTTSGEPRVFEDLFGRHREKLRRTVRLRLDKHLRGRVSSQSVLDRAERVAGEKLRDYDPASGDSFYLWLRTIVGEQIRKVHAEHQVLLENLEGRELQLLRGRSRM